MKKVLSIITAATMLGGSVPAFAAKADYEKLIPDVKNRLGIPEEFSEFSYDGETQNWQEKKVYIFSWTNPDTDDSISVYTDESGVVSSYWNWHDSDQYDYMKADEKTKAAAESFIAAMNPALKGNIRLDSNGYQWGDTDYTIYISKNGIEYSQPAGNIEISSDGTVKSARLTTVVFSDEDVSKPVSKEAAHDTFLKNNGLELEYCTYRDDEGRLNAFPAYAINQIHGVSAANGELIEFGEDNEVMYNMALESASMGGTAEDSGYKGLTDSEIAELARVEGFISPEKARQIVEDFAGIELKDVVTNLYSADGEGEYSMWSSSVYASVDAATGDIISVTLTDKENKSSLSRYDFSSGESMEKLAADAAPSWGKKFTYDTKAEQRYHIMPIADEEKSEFSALYYNVNGIKVSDASATIEKTQLDKGVRYSIYISPLDEYEAIEYPAPDGFLAPEQVFKEEDMVLNYIPSGDTARAAYIPENYNLINAITGERVGWDNKPPYEYEEYNYSDIDNHWVKEAAKKLALAGIGFEGGELCPNKPVTAAEALTIIQIDLFNRFDADTDDEAQTITRADVAKLLVKGMGLESLAKSDVFKQPYTDTASDFGAIAILKGMGIIAADSSTFRPNDNITRAEFLQMVYNTIMTKGR